MTKPLEVLITRILKLASVAEQTNINESSQSWVAYLNEVSPANVRELIAALEQSQQQNKELIDERTASTLEMSRIIQREIKLRREAEKHIAEFKASQLTVKLPPHKFSECVNGLLEEAIAYAGTQQLRSRLSSRLSNFVKPDHVAGITVQGDK